MTAKQTHTRLVEPSPRAKKDANDGNDNAITKLRKVAAEDQAQIVARWLLQRQRRRSRQQFADLKRVIFVSLRTVHLCDRLRAPFGRQQPHGCPAQPASRQLREKELALLSESFKLWRNDNNNLSAFQALGETDSQRWNG